GEKSPVRTTLDFRTGLLLSAASLNESRMATWVRFLNESPFSAKRSCRRCIWHSWMLCHDTPKSPGMWCSIDRSILSVGYSEKMSEKPPHSEAGILGI